MEELYACAQEGRHTKVRDIVEQLLEDTAPHPHAEWQLFAQTRLALALRLAASNDHIDVVRVVLASLGLPAFLSAILYEPYNAHSALTVAARHGRTSILDLFTQNLLLTGNDVHTELNDALSAAVLGGVCDDFPGVVRVLVSAKADPTRFLADVAGGCGNADMLRALLSHKANVRTFDFRADTALHCAIEFNPHPTDVVSQLLDAKADPDVQNLPWSWSPLYIAASRMMESTEERHQCMHLLLQAKADVNGINEQRTIIAAVNNSDAPTVRMLLRAKSAVDWPGGQSALHTLLQCLPSTTRPAKTTLSIARTLIAVKANVGVEHVRTAAAHHSFEMISHVFLAHADRPLAAKTVLSNVQTRRTMKTFVEREMGGDLTSIDAANPGELVDMHGRRKRSSTVLRVLIEAKAAVRSNAILSAVSSDDPRVLDVLRIAGASVDKQMLELALAKAETYGYDNARAKLAAMLAATLAATLAVQTGNDAKLDDDNRPPKLKRMR